MIIKNGQIALPGHNDFSSLDIEIRRGKIVDMGKDLPGGPVMDAEGLQVFPGAVDPHVHFNEPGYTAREDFFHGSCEALSGGVTTVIDMPCTSVPPVTRLRHLRKKLDIVSRRAVTDFALFGGVSAQCFEQGFPGDMRELAPWVPGFKTYFLSGMDTFRHVDLPQFRRVLETARELQRTVLLHAEDAVLVKSLQARYRGDTWLDYYRSRPEEAEIRAVRNALREARTVGAALHIVHVATAEAAGLIREDPDVSAETAPHYLEFCTEDLERIGSALKTAPVVKPAGNREKLWEYLADGTLDFVASDHAPAPAEQKNTGSPRRDYAGIPGTGTIFPYCYSEGFVKRGIPLPRFLKITAENAAKRYRLFDRKASIETGKDADLIFVDPAGERVIRGKDLYSKGKITPFENMTLRGRIIKTMLRGDIVYDNEKGITANAGCGRFLKPGDAPELSPCQENIRGEQDHA